MQTDLSVVIPVYKSENILSSLLERLATVLPQISTQYEVILVNDGSPDRSWEKIVALSAKYPWLRGIRLMRNYGQHNAILRGVRAARYGIIVTMDDDLQHPPEEIVKLLAELDKGCDVVYGYPESESHVLWRSLSSQLTKWLLRVGLGIPGIERSGAFRAFRAHLREAFADYRSSFVSIDVLLSWGTTRFSFVPVRHDPREIGASNYNFAKLIVHMFNMVTGFSTLPLQLASVLGFSLTFFGFGVLVYVVGRYLIQGSPVQGFPFLASIVSIFSGAQLFALGIFGEYLARMYFRLVGKPQSVVQEEIGFPAPDLPSGE